MDAWWFDPKFVIQQCPTIVVLLGVVYYSRKDRAVEQEKNAAERTEMQKTFQESLEKVADSFDNAVAQVVKKSEQTEKMGEARFELVLSTLLTFKGQNTPTKKRLKSTDL